MIYNCSRVVGSKYVHVKSGRVYTLICFPVCTETYKKMVVYTADGVECWSQPTERFFGKTNTGVVRFKRVDIK